MYIMYIALSTVCLYCRLSLAQRDMDNHANILTAQINELRHKISDLEGDIKAKPR